jgi:prepilin-type N-terminal cleavage/methylation domain-containing protein/prepilin-type processing-associated H-X9-DG protein
MGRAFTLIELLVVISIVALLVALLLPALDKARETARIVQCGSRQRQLFTAAQAYGADVGEYPMRMTEQEKNTFGLNCSGSSFGGTTGWGKWTVRTLAERGYHDDEKLGQCNAPLPNGFEWATWSNTPWYFFNGPYANGSHITGKSHASGLRRLGKHVHENKFCEATWGVDYNFQNYRASNRSWRTEYAPADIALVGCPSVMVRGPSTPTTAFEPHMEQPMTAAGPGNPTYHHRRSDKGPILKYRRNYTFADGHVQFLRRDTRISFSETP